MKLLLSLKLSSELRTFGEVELFLLLVLTLSFLCFLTFCSINGESSSSYCHSSTELSLYSCILTFHQSSSDSETSWRFLLIQSAALYYLLLNVNQQLCFLATVFASYYFIFFRMRLGAPVLIKFRFPGFLGTRSPLRNFNLFAAKSILSSLLLFSGAPNVSIPAV